METWREPARDLPVAGRPDVLVVGAGSAGVAAAVSAARHGADTWLVEKSATVGGLATAGLINLLLTLDDGAGQAVVAGLCQEFVDRLAARGEARFPDPSQWNSEDPGLVDEWRQWGLVWGAPESVRYSVAYDPEPFVDVCLDALAESGVRVRLHSLVAGADVRDGSIQAVYVESKRGREAILPAAVIDASGDGDVMAAAGAPFELVPIPPHLWFRAGGVSPEADPGVFFFRTGAAGRALVPWGPSGRRVDPTDPDDMTAAELACRREAAAAFDAMRKTVPGFSDAWLHDYAGMLGITESRRLAGDFVLAKEDGDARFEDAVARTGHWTRRGVVFEIPFRCLTTAAADNLVVAGRCISVTRYVHQATKEIPAAMATGEAAGAAAALAVRAGVAPRSVDTGEVRRVLRRAGASLGDDVNTEASAGRAPEAGGEATTGPPPGAGGEAR